MPKETIRDDAGMYDIIVGWEREKYLQVGIATADGQPIAEKLTVTSADSESGQTSETAEFTSLWGTLDRHGVNRLIWQLRKARDAAFGKDA